MSTGLPWVCLSVVLAACNSQPASAPAVSEPTPATGVAPVSTPQAPPSSSLNRKAEPAPAASMVGTLNADSDGEPRGRLEPAVIQNAVREHYGIFRKCYEAGLERNRDLKGRVSARFVIELDGRVSNVSNGGSELPDHETISCVLRAFYDIRFPPPEGGTVTVVYPIMLEPG